MRYHWGLAVGHMYSRQRPEPLHDKEDAGRGSITDQAVLPDEEERYNEDSAEAGHSIGEGAADCSDEESQNDSDGSSISDNDKDEEDYDDADLLAFEETYSGVEYDAFD
jgi:hypothetical protein